MKFRNLLLSAVSALTLLSCGGGGGSSSSMNAGGIGGTGVSSGPVTGFGSVIVNGVEYNTDAANFTVEGSIAGKGSTGQSKLAAGMIVSVAHDSSIPPLAKSVSFRDNAEGPIALLAVNTTTGAGTFTVLGLAVTVNNLTVFANTSGLIGSTPLNDGDIVEVSGQLTGTNELVATRVENKMSTTCTSGIEVKGTVRNVDAGSGRLDITSSQDTLHINANGHMPSTLQNGDYIEVKSNTCPASSTMVASAIIKDSSVHEGPDLSKLDAGANALEIKGIVTDAGGAASACSFTVNGQPVLTTSSTQINGGSGANCTTLINGTLVKVEGHLNNGTLVASTVQNEDSESVAADHFVGTIVVDTHSSAFEGTIHVDTSSVSSPPIVADLNTQFEGQTQQYDLETMKASPTCAEVEVNTVSGGLHAISIHQEDCGH